MHHISAKIILKSINVVTEDVVTTFLLEYPRIIHSELLTHRVFSRNSASSRAIPVKTQINRLKQKHYHPMAWGENKAGMASDRELDSEKSLICSRIWDNCLSNTIYQVDKLGEIGLHKQLANRLLEPFSIMQVVLTGTDFKNFYSLRDSQHSQPEIRELAIAMKEADRSANSNELNIGEWHIPFATNLNGLLLKDRLDVSVGKCAKVSYYVKNEESIENSLKLTREKLLPNKHLSPFEHPCMAIHQSVRIGNFVGFMQYRKFIESDSLDKDVPMISNQEAKNTYRRYFVDSNI